MRPSVLVAIFVLLLAFTISAAMLYRGRFEKDLEKRARNLIAATAGLEQVHVEFRNFDAHLSGTVDRPDLKESTERLVASLPAARVVSNEIRVPVSAASVVSVEDTPTEMEPPQTPAPPAPPPPPPAPPPPPPAPELRLLTDAGAITLQGDVPDLHLKADILTSIAGTFARPEIRAADLVIKSGLIEANWPESLPAFLAFLVSRTIDADFIIDRERVNLRGTAIDAESLSQINERLGKLEFPGRTLSAELVEAPPVAVSDGEFFLKMRYQDNKIFLEGRLPDENLKIRLLEILGSDHSALEISGDIAVDQDLETPLWAPRIPNLLSLICSRTRNARLTITQEMLHIVGEMMQNQPADNLLDVMILMLDPQVIVQSHLFTYEQAASDSTASLSSPRREITTLNPEPKPK